MAMKYGLNVLRDHCLRIAIEHGFTDASPGEDIALIHSEASEALEDIRAGHGLNEYWKRQDGKPLGVPSEMADIIIRVLHFCGKHGIDIDEAVFDKMKYNESRPYKHGKVL
jgi:NTP pyrophosphatase (non-canonical NTP hydrolase)